MLEKLIQNFFDSKISILEYFSIKEKNNFFNIEFYPNEKWYIKDDLLYAGENKYMIYTYPLYEKDNFVLIKIFKNYSLVYQIYDKNYLVG